MATAAVLAALACGIAAGAGIHWMTGIAWLVSLCGIPVFIAVSFGFHFLGAPVKTLWDAFVEMGPGGQASLAAFDCLLGTVLLLAAALFTGNWILLAIMLVLLWLSLCMFRQGLLLWKAPWGFVLSGCTVALAYANHHDWVAIMFGKAVLEWPAAFIWSFWKPGELWPIRADKVEIHAEQ